MKFVCPVPRLKYDQVQMVHGAGGMAMGQLIDDMFLAAFDNPLLRCRDDAAVLPNQWAVSTDCFVVDPIFFPGGNIGTLAIYGTVNDVAVSGATPRYVTAGFILEEGFSMVDLRVIVASMREAADDAGVQIVAGDTKVVPRGKADKIYINTTGLGILQGPALSVHRIRPGDLLIVSGTLGDHGIAVMSQREGLSFETDVTSDCAALFDLVQLAVDQGKGAVHACRDATRGGLVAVLHEFAQASHTFIQLHEAQIPIRESVRGACEMLGIDAMNVANEGKLVLAIAPEGADAVLRAWQSHPLGRQSAIIGEIHDEGVGVVINTRFGTQRVLDLPVGEPLPRIC
ncbi:MAG: hydrogenase expression/formation protein HypE [Acidobacteria bacterium]|nr:hydrogenase expression/formation protein HypE [Acidobacteriota bacterium]